MLTYEAREDSHSRQVYKRPCGQGCEHTEWAWQGRFLIAAYSPMHLSQSYGYPLELTPPPTALHTQASRGALGIAQGKSQLHTSTGALALDRRGGHSKSVVYEGKPLIQ